MSELAELYGRIAEVGGDNLTDLQARGIARAYTRSRYCMPPEGCTRGEEQIVLDVQQAAETIILRTPIGRAQEAALCSLDDALLRALAARSALPALPDLPITLYRG